MMANSFFDTDNGLMKWNFESVIKETEHPFLNFYTVNYKVLKQEGVKDHHYFLASRKDTNDLRAVSHDYRNPDGVIIGLYRLVNGKLEILLTKQFRPPVGDYVFSISAGLIDPGEDLFEAAKREAKEEVGVDELHDIEILTPFSPTSSGMSDEANAFIMARVDKQEGNDLEEFEDISSCFVPIDKILEMFKNPKYIFPLHVRVWVMYMAERFKN